MNRVARAAFIASALATAACNGGGSGTHPLATTPPPARAPDGEPSLTAGPATAYTSITVKAGGREAEVPASLASGLAPLVIARDFGQQSLSQYGLDEPQATLEFMAGGRVVATVQIGSADFDRRGFYAQRGGDSRVFLVLSDPIRPILALVGITAAPPAG